MVSMKKPFLLVMDALACDPGLLDPALSFPGDNVDSERLKFFLTGRAADT